MAFVFEEAQLVDIRRYCGYPPRRVYQRVLYDATELEFTLTILTDEEAARVTDIFLPQLAAAEQEIFAARQNLEDDQVAVIKHNPMEMAQRRAAYRTLRFDLIRYLGVKPGPYLGGGSARWSM